MKTRKYLTKVLPVAAGLALLAACGGGSDSPTSPSGDARGIYPVYADDNGDGVNDYVQSATHDPGTAGGHAYVDADGNGICDRAEDGSASWHGPGYVDDDGDGVCDRWESGTALNGAYGSAQFRDDNGNGVNDYAEGAWHGQPGHAFVDADNDGICDLAQNGGPNWHGPGYIDDDGDGVCDNWQSGGGAYGRPGSGYGGEGYGPGSGPGGTPGEGYGGSGPGSGGMPGGGMRS